MKSWDEFFKSLKKEEFYIELEKFLEDEYKNNIIYPPKNIVFRAFDLTPYEKVKVVIIGQDPYSHIDEANGLAFSVNINRLPPSLKNIYKEIELEFDEKMNFSDGKLEYLAKQGVLLLNTILTVREGKPLSHDNELYKTLFLKIMQFLEEKEEPIVYLLWGNKAKKYKKYILNPNHFYIETNHPSPLSANQGGWFNSYCFKKCNDILEKNGLTPIEWINN